MVHILLRDGTRDKAIYNEVVERRVYDRFMSPANPGDVWLDGGANIGCFSTMVAPFCDSVVAFEPDLDNFLQLMVNLNANDCWNVFPVHAALVGNDDKMRPLYLSEKDVANHTLRPTRRRSSTMVDCVNVNAAVREYGVNRVKLDVEGAEGEILDVLDLGPLDELVVEYHFRQAGDDMLHTRYRALVTRLREEFPFVTAPNAVGTQAWCVMLRAGMQEVRK